METRALDNILRSRGGFMVGDGILPTNAEMKSIQLFHPFTDDGVVQFQAIIQ